ncbi:glycosyltransferase [Brumimicrobium oceani]|uniref:Transmembrane glycosyltransferase n=1 Tax=Brumimicrobium oceani TaxID=2100725 RepID=A0A2U2X0N9_9FLAO|nr:glycosyltransferase [Brumimicrobium oceani]PWH81343.1 transmembrane glycosyltransferase [Brumimicrobium oceani]
MDSIPDFSDPLQSTLSIILWAMAFIQLFWIFFFYSRIAFHQEKSTDENNLPPVSIIICARNEEDNLFELLPFILEQDYGEFEVIVVNHQSTDNTFYILKAFQEKYSHLKVIHLERNHHLAMGKKLPLTLGIKGAKYNHLLLTDADCKPSSKLWLRTMANQFSQKKEMVLGYGPHNKTSGLLNRFIRLDTAIIALNYLSFAKAGIPYMGVGRNLAYTKDLFLSNSGFKSHYSISSGDDDLFVQEVAKNKNYGISLSPLGFCYSDGKEKWSDLYLQKSRHYGTTGRYSLFKKLLLGIYPLSLILLTISLFTLLAIGGITWISIGIVAFVLISKWIIFGLAMKKLEQSGFIWSILLWDLIYAVSSPVLYYTSAKSTGSRWK